MGLGTVDLKADRIPTPLDRDAWLLSFKLNDEEGEDGEYGRKLVQCGIWQQGFPGRYTLFLDGMASFLITES